MVRNLTLLFLWGGRGIFVIEESNVLILWLSWNKLLWELREIKIFGIVSGSYVVIFFKEFFKVAISASQRDWFYKFLNR